MRQVSKNTSQEHSRAIEAHVQLSWVSGQAFIVSSDLLSSGTVGGVGLSVWCECGVGRVCRLLAQGLSNGLITKHTPKEETATQ